ncbi:VOC family protein [Cellulomonas phragmiteti]|uniref:Glyoxalase-like domain-containing protein n=1 Tax=Cellulomonas phragmiteti TaxID=478780 RepID=A0ABQ4DFY8_9CELL|nr:VOC family protein [Cellulomonas phragmiteti]GIG38255.1 hypothetical protein Cph01nite_00170 [Cellulomonas phragmiteti]
MTVTWTTAFIDLPGPAHAAGRAFWCAVTATTPSEPRGDEGQFATLLPPAGDAFLRVQRLEGPPRIHLDLHVDDVTVQARRARSLGARVLLHQEHVVLASPGGFVHCLVPDAGEQVRPDPVTGPRGGTAQVDQVCLDVPPALLPREVAYWTALTGWPARAGSRPEFTVLDRPPGMPLRLMLQELGAQDARTATSAHLDLACGPDVGVVADEHRARGARVVDDGHPWVVVRDPAGLDYCLTPRDPWTGLVG